MSELVLREDRDGAATLTLNRPEALNALTLRVGKRLVNEGQSYSHAEGLAFERRTSPGAGPELAERLARFRAKS